MAAGRIFQALNRAETKTILAHEVRDELVSQLKDYGEEVLAVRFDYTLELSAYPAESERIDKHFVGEIEGDASKLPGAIADYVKAQLDKDSTFAGHLTFPKVTWNWTIHLTAARDQALVVPAPAAPQPIVSADRRSLDLRPLSRQILPDSQAQPADLATLSDPHVEGIRKATDRMLSTGVSEPGPSIDRRAMEIATIRADQQRFEAEREAPSALDARLDRLESMMEKLILGTTPRESETAVDKALVISGREAERIAASRPHIVPNVRRMTPTGLEITGGAKPSPGADAANSYGGGVAVGQLVVVDRLVAEGGHPPLETGGAGAPDALRRQHDLPIPAPTETPRGGIVDLPGVF